MARVVTVCRAVAASRVLLAGNCETCGHPWALHPFPGERRNRGCLVCRSDLAVQLSTPKEQR